uniref:Uncharacterized protein n=1 Tax=Sphaerodactylus townsendi TaxID=933632 RepID=A0ACB8EQG3_9SAUR
MAPATTLAPIDKELPENFEVQMTQEWDRPSANRRYLRFLRKLFAKPSYTNDILQVPPVDDHGHPGTQGDPVRIRHSHSPRSCRQSRRSQCSDGERSVLSEVKLIVLIHSAQLTIALARINTDLEVHHYKVWDARDWATFKDQSDKKVVIFCSSKMDLVSPLPVTRCSDAQYSTITVAHKRRNGSKDSLLEDKTESSINLDGRHSTKTVKIVQASRLKMEA